MSPNGGGAGPAPAEESKRSEDAMPFDVRVVIGGKPCMGRWQFSCQDNRHYFVHADGEWVTPSDYCSPNLDDHYSDEQSSHEAHESDYIGVVDGAEYLGPDERHDFYFYSALDDDAAVCVQSPILVDNPYEDVLVLDGVMHPGKMHPSGVDYLVFEHDRPGRITIAYPSTASDSQEELSDEDEQ